jgi:hypothetical protein
MGMMVMIMDIHHRVLVVAEAQNKDQREQKRDINATIVQSRLRERCVEEY